MEDKSILETIEDSFLDLIDSAVAYIPNILAALLLLIVGILLAGFISRLVGRLIDAVEKNKSVIKVANKLNLKIVKLSDIVALLTKWAILLIFINAAVDALGIDVLTETFNKIIDFLPNIFVASVIAAFSIIAANVVKDIVGVSAKKANIRPHAFLASAAQVVVLIFGLPLALAQLGLDLSIINNNITVVVGGIMLALGLSFGLGGKETAGKIVDNAYKNWKK